MAADLSRLTLLVIDSGYFTFLAQELAKYYGKVLYARPTISVFLESKQHSIGNGLPGIEWVDEPERHYDKADEILYPDVNYGPQQVYLHSKGYKICGALGGELMEQDKYLALGKLAAAGLTVPKTWAFVKKNGKPGLDRVWEFLKDKKERLWVKPADKYRGDLDTFLHYDPRQTEIDFDAIREQIGILRSKEVGVLVQRDIPDAIEIGPDLFRNGAERSSTFGVGLEDKGMFYIGRKFSDPPGVLKDFFAKTAPIYGELGYQGPYSSELRVTNDGTAYPIDETNRCGNPPTASLVKFYGKDYARAVHDCANGRTPDIDSEYSHFGEMVLRTDKYMKKDLYVSVPDELKDWLMLKNASARDGDLYCIENGTHGQFASLVAVGNSVEEVCSLLEERVKLLRVPKLEYIRNCFDVMRPKIDKAKEYASIDLDKGDSVASIAAAA